MAGFQQSLTDVTPVDVGKAPSGGGIPTAPSAFASILQGATALTGLADQGIKIFEDVQRKDVAEKYNTDLIKLVDAKNQGIINSSTFTTKTNQLFVEHAQRNPEHTQIISGITKDILGFVPFASTAQAEQSAENEFLKKGTLLKPNATDSEKIEVGRAAYQLERQAEIDKAKAEAAVKQHTLNGQAQLSTAQTYMNALIETASFNAMQASAISIAADTETLSEKQLAAQSFSQVKALADMVEAKYMDHVRTMDPSVQGKAKNIWDDYRKSMDKIFDPNTGPLNLKLYSDFSTAMANNMKMDNMQLTKTVSAFKEVLGSEATAMMMQRVISTNPNTESQLINLFKGELQNLMSGGVISQDQSTRASTILSLAQNREAADILVSTGQARADKLASNTLMFKDMVDKSQNNDEIIQGTYLNYGLNLAQLGVQHLTNPTNIHTVTSSFDSPGHVSNLSRLEKLDPQMARELGQRVLTLSTKDVGTIMKNAGGEQYLRYDIPSGKFTIDPMAQPEASPDDTGAAAGASYSEFLKVKKYADELNTALRVAEQHQKYDPLMAKMSPLDARNYIVSSLQVANGVDFFKGEALPKRERMTETSPSVQEVVKQIQPRQFAVRQQAQALAATATEKRREMLGMTKEQTKNRVIGFMRPGED